MTNSHDIARENARDRATGQFGEQPKSAPEVNLAPARLTPAQEMQLGMREPTNENTFQDAPRRGGRGTNSVPADVQ